MNSTTTRTSNADQDEDIEDSPSPSSSESSKRTYDKWTEVQEVYLIDLWSEYQNELESTQSRKSWAKILERLNKRFKASWTLAQIQRKTRYFKEQYKKANDWNRKQSGGNRKTCPYFTKMNEILGKKDSVTMKHVVSAGNSSTCSSTSSTQECTDTDDQESNKDEDKEMKAKGKTAKEARRERKLKRTSWSLPRDPMDEDEENKQSKLDNTLDVMQQQGAKIADTMQSIVTSMQENQTQQVQFMGEFMKVFASMSKQTQEKDN
ncbi:hypothetical protein QZH41_002970 [Actinostola sp. cb2023]|nr:hypothetical protein QZH41_002970 [Actinostola sp. cb2023]